MQDRYDELDNIVMTLDVLIDETKDEYFRASFMDLKFEAQEEMEKIENDLRKEQWGDEFQLNLEYERSV